MDRGDRGATSQQLRYEGSAAVKRINQGLLALMDRDGVENIRDVVASQA